MSRPRSPPGTACAHRKGGLSQRSRVPETLRKPLCPCSHFAGNQLLPVSYSVFSRPRDLGCMVGQPLVRILSKRGNKCSSHSDGFCSSPLAKGSASLGTGREADFGDHPAAAGGREAVDPWRMGDLVPAGPLGLNGGRKTQDGLFNPPRTRIFKSDTQGTVGGITSPTLEQHPSRNSQR